MAERGSRTAERARWQDTIIQHLGDFPRQYAALESAMGAFGDDFDIQAFKAAFDTNDDMEAYNRVQALERAVGRVQNYVADVADAGVKLAELPRSADHASEAEQAFATLRESKIINGNLCRRLIRAQGARRRMEHSYITVKAGDVHSAANLVHDSARDFIAAYRDWIEPYLRPPCTGDTKST